MMKKSNVTDTQKKFLAKPGAGVIILVTVVMITVMPLPCVVAEEQKPSSRPITEMVPELSALILQPFYTTGKAVIGLGGLFASLVALMKADNVEEGQRAGQEVLNKTWADPWSFPDFVHGERHDPLISTTKK